jgi:hypothetical protein
MDEIFSLFIKPNPSYQNWSQLHSFGQPLPADDPQKLSYYCHLAVSDENDADIYAAVKGELSTLPPSGFLSDIEELINEETDDGSQQGVTLYLTPSMAKLNSDYLASLEPLAMATSNIEQVGVTPYFSRDILLCFVYLNVDRLTLQANMHHRMKALKQKIPPPWENFLAGKVKIRVSSGDLLAKAGNPYLSTDKTGTRQLGFGVVTQSGVYDPGAFYDGVQDFLIEQDKPFASALADDLLGIHWPIIPNTSLPENIGKNTLYPYSALLHYKNSRHLSYADWRIIGDRQKALYLKRLIRRIRPDLSGDLTTPRFKFDMADTHNIFQLEAVTQFYANLPEPWDLTKSPKEEGDDGFQKINLLALYGEAATVVNKEISLDTALDFSRITPGIDVIVLDADTARPEKQYRITNINTATKTVTVDDSPLVTGTTSWHISHRPILVLIDSFGYRVQGETAVSAGGDKIKLLNLSKEQKIDLGKINKNFDTISLQNTESPFFHEFRIKDISVSKNHPEATITVDKNGPTPLIGNPTPWHIPSGIGGQQGAVKRPVYITNNAYKWWDHYDGMMFAVINGHVESIMPWSSYTSRKGKGEQLSSIKGNQLYHISSYLSPKHSFIFKVVDRHSHVTGTQATKISTTPKGETILDLHYPLSNTFLKPLLYWYNKKKDKWIPRNNKVVPLMLYSFPDKLFGTVYIKLFNESTNQVTLTQKSEVPDQLSSWRMIQYDGVHEAYGFFSQTVKSDVAPAEKVAPFGKLGKGLIRLHTGYINGSGSEGCLVSPYFADLRNLLMEHHLTEYAFYYKDKPNLASMQKIRSAQKLPPAFDTYKSLNDKLNKYKGELTEWSKLKEAIEKLLEDGVDQEEEFEQLLYLLGEIFELSEVSANLGDNFDEEIFSRSVENIFEILSDEKIQTLLYTGDVAQDLSAQRFKYLEEAIKSLLDKLKAERRRLGWDNILIGTLWLIRPDERPVPA